MLKKNEEKVVNLQQVKKEKQRPRGSRISPLAAELNQQLKSRVWLDRIRAAGL